MAEVTGCAAFKVKSSDQGLMFHVRYADIDVQKQGQWQMVAWQSTRLPEK